MHKRIFKAPPLLTTIVNPPLGGGGAYLFQNHLRGAYLRGGGGVFNLAETMVSVLHKKTRMHRGKAQVKKLEVMQPRIKGQICTFSG